MDEKKEPEMIICRCGNALKLPIGVRVVCKCGWEWEAYRGPKGSLGFKRMR